MVAPAPLGAAAGVVADLLLGEPGFEPHPVALFGRAMEKVERRLYRDNRARGVAHAGAGLAVGASAGMALRRVAGSGLGTAAGAYVAVAQRQLARTAVEIGALLEGGRLEEARGRLPELVGRDPAGLDEKEMARAVVESVAENTVDAVVAPALWAALAGAPGALGYRAANTMDAMVGHRSARYSRYGWAAARLDDAANWAPARVTAGLVALARPRAAGAVVGAVRRDAGTHPSPNAGVAEAAFAAALGLRLGGVNRYGNVRELRPELGDGRPAEPADIGPAVRLSRDVTVLLVAVLVGAGLAGRRG